MRESHLHHCLSSLAKIAALAAVAAAFGWSPVDAAAAPRFDAPRPAARPASTQDSDLEEMFWLCDYAATTGMVDPDERAVCSTITDQLQMDRFGGDFEQMLRWWQANKLLRHRQLERDADANAVK
jgi:invasion protein IalB